MPPLDLPLRHRTNVLFRSLLSHRIQLYSVASVVAVSAVILNALRNYSNFYSVAIYLSRSGRSVLVRVYHSAHFQTQFDSCTRPWRISRSFWPYSLDTSSSVFFSVHCVPTRWRYGTTALLFSSSLMIAFSGYMTGYGFLSQSLCWLSPFSEMNLTYPLS